MAPAPPRAVLDTSVLVPVWSRRLLTTVAASRPVRYTPIWCEWIIAETWRVLAVQRLRRRPHFTAADEHHLSASANRMLTALLPVMTFVSVVLPFSPAWETPTDPDDLPIWTAAVRSNAAFIISHNLRDFPPRDDQGFCRYAGIEYITVESFVSEVLGLDPAAVAPVPIPPGGRLGHRRRIEP